MTQRTDMVIDGAGYMLVPGHYTRTQDGAPEGRTGRISFRDFFGGQRRHLQLERDRGFDGLNVGPVLGRQGVQPWGRHVAGGSLTSAVLPSADVPIPSAVCRGRLYFALGTKIFECAAPGSAWTAPIAKIDTGSAVKDMCLYASTGVLCTFGVARDVTWYRVSDGASTVLLAREQGHWIGGYGGYAIWSDARPAARENYTRMVTGTRIDQRILDYEIIGFANADAKFYAITRSAIYSYSGRVREVRIANPAYTSTNGEPTTVPSLEWQGDWEPFYQHGVASERDDFRLFEGFGGKIYSWVAGEVMEFNPNGDRAGWRATGLTGRQCFGGTVAGGYLVVALESWEGNSELWAWDGSGWWRFGRKAMEATGYWIWPRNVNNAGSCDLLVFHHGAATYDVIRLQHRSASLHAFPAAGTVASFQTPMIDAGERDKLKAWRKIGAVFATPERSGSLGSTTEPSVSIEYSTDGGASWTSGAATSRAGNTLAHNNFVLDADIAGAGASSRFLMIRLNWWNVTDWAPVLVGLWCEFEVMDSPARRRRWNLQVAAHDQTVDRAGAVLSRTGRQLIAELWSKWQGGTTLAFRDSDYDADSVERTVRIVGISESAPKPADHGRWGDSVVSLQLVEV